MFPPATLFICINLFAVVQSANISQHNALETHQNRTSKFVGWWGIGLVRFENKHCTTPEGLDGTCYTRRQCREIDGSYSGNCAGKFGKCCTIQRGCGATSTLNNTYFVNSNYPAPVIGSSACTYVIKKCHAEVCQARLDFLTFNLAHPSAQGECLYDSMRITGAASVVRPICGENSGQHLYLNFRGGGDITITIVTSGSSDLTRSWYLKVAQIDCDSTSKAPPGCLQYYSDASGTVTSFNYGRATSANILAPNTPGTRELAGQEYGVCVRAVPGYCSIKWEATSARSFAVSGDTSITEPQTDCTDDYVLIPNGIEEGGARIDRYCGNTFPTVISNSIPFVLYYITDKTELEGETGNLGFSLDYSQVRCNPLAL